MVNETPREDNNSPNSNENYRFRRQGQNNQIIRETQIVYEVAAEEDKKDEIVEQAKDADGVSKEGKIEDHKDFDLESRTLLEKFILKQQILKQVRSAIIERWKKIVRAVKGSKKGKAVEETKEDDGAAEEQKMENEDDDGEGLSTKVSTIMNSVQIISKPGEDEYVYEEELSTKVSTIMNSVQIIKPPGDQSADNCAEKNERERNASGDLLELQHKVNEAESPLYKLVIDMKNKTKPSLQNCFQLGDQYRSDKDYFKSMLFYLIGGELLVDIDDVSDVRNGMPCCTLGIQRCMKGLVDERPTHNEFLKLQVIPIMRKMVRQISGIEEKRTKSLCLIEATCKHHVQLCEALVGDYNAREATLEESISILESTLGEEAKKIHMYSTALRNLGITFLQQEWPEEARGMLARAIEATMTTEGYATEEDRKADIEKCESAITQVDEMLKKKYILISFTKIS